MFNHARIFLALFGASAIVVVGILAFESTRDPNTERSADRVQVAATLAQEPEVRTSPAANTPVSPSTASENDEVAYASRVESPYSYPPESFPAIHAKTLPALVNILCTAQDATLKSISGSGVIIDPQGVILTNAHIAQYVLLAESGKTKISCSVRSGSPARAAWKTEVLYLPRVWVKEHAPDITDAFPMGTGEHDYALLSISRSVDEHVPLPAQFPYLPLDTREVIAFQGDAALSASYPAEFVGDEATQAGLYPISSVGRIEELMTFGTGSVDLISLEGVFEAQNGSSGGPIVNAWGRLVGIITTASMGPTIHDRELHALTLSYINRDMVAQSGEDITTLLTGDTAEKARAFREHDAPSLANLIIESISNNTQEPH